MQLHRFTATLSLFRIGLSALLVLLLLPSGAAAGAVRFKESRPFPFRTVIQRNEAGELTCLPASGDALHRLLGESREPRAGQPPEVVRQATSYSTFIVTYQGFTPAAKTAFQRAVDLVAAMIASDAPIKIKASFESLPSNKTLGSAGPTLVYVGETTYPEGNFWFASALADSLAGSDLAPGATDYDIEARFNKDFPDWYFGTDEAPPFEKTDFIQVVMHELLHGLGFITSFKIDPVDVGAWGITGSSSGTLPLIFDRFIVDGDGNRLIDANYYPNNSAGLAAAMASNNLFFLGPETLAANNFSPPRIYAPAEFEASSSLAHFDEFTFPSLSPHALMTPKQTNGEANHTISSLTIGAFREIGWSAMATLPFPQFAAGGGIASDVVITNLSSTATASGDVECFDWQTGARLDPAGFINGADTSFTIPPLGSKTFQSRSSGDLVLGSAVILSDNPVSGVIRFAIAGTGVAGVGSSLPVDSAIIPVRREGTLSTGIAVQNPGLDAIEVQLTLRDESGDPVSHGHATYTIPSHGRLAQFLSELFPQANTQPFKGSLTVEATSGKFAAIGLELKAGSVFTTLPVGATR